MMLLGLIAWPLLSGCILFLFAERHRWAQALNILFNFVWIYFLLGAFNEMAPATESSPAFAIGFDWYWLPILKSHFALAIDGISLPLIGLNVLLSLLLAFYSFGKEKLSGAYLGLFSILNAGSVGSLLAADMLTFYIFWEFMLIPMYFLIGRWGGKKRVYAALKFFAFTMMGSLPMLLAILALAYQANSPSLLWHDLVAAKTPFTGWASMQGLCFVAFALAFSVKVPIWPLHVWLPDAHSEAPTGGSVILAGILLKLGVYGLLRWCLPLFPEASIAAAPVMLTLGCIGVILGSLAAWRQTDIKRLIAYSSVAHLGFMVLGIFSMRVESMQGALFQNIAHGLSTGALFLIFGIVYDRTHSRALAEYGGLATKSPVVAALFVVASMASIGLPGLPGFIGEFLILSGSFAANHWVALVSMWGVVLGAVYMLGLLRKMVFGPTTALVEGHPVRFNWNEWISVAPLILLMVLLGFLPQWVLNQSESAVNSILKGLR